MIYLIEYRIASNKSSAFLFGPKEKILAHQSLVYITDHKEKKKGKLHKKNLYQYFLLGQAQ